MGREEEAAAARRSREKVCLRDPALSLNTARSILRGGSGSASGQLRGATAWREAAERASRSDCASTRRSTTGSISEAITTVATRRQRARAGGRSSRPERRRCPDASVPLFEETGAGGRGLGN